MLYDYQVMIMKKPHASVSKCTQQPSAACSACPGFELGCALCWSGWQEVRQGKPHHTQHTAMSDQLSGFSPTFLRWDAVQPLSSAGCCSSTGAGSAPCTQHLRWLQVDSQLELRLLQWTLATLPTWKLQTAANFKGICIPEHTLLWNQR